MLAEAADQRALSRVAGRYGRLALLLDELGYAQADPRGAELFFQIITERDERALDRDWDKPPVPRVGRRLPRPPPGRRDRRPVTFNAHILETGTQSCRLAASKTSRHNNQHQRRGRNSSRPAGQEPGHSAS